MAAVDRLNGLIQSLAIKAPCRVATTANLTAMNGLLTIDGVVLAQDDRVLVKNQSNPIQNGIYKADSGDWSRDLDCDGSGDLMQGTIVFVVAGTVGGSSVWQVTSVNPVIVGSSNITFAATGSAALAVASAFMLNTFFPITTAALALAALGGAELAGGNTFSGQQNFNGLLALSAALNEAKGADIASATTTNIGAATGNFVHVTGTTTITGLGTIQSGTRRKVVFDGVLTITHNATSLICLTGASIQTAAGDIAEFESEGAGNWRMTSYERKSGVPLAGITSTIAGLTYANNAGDATNDLDIAPGAATDGTNGYLMTLAASITKQSDVTWAVGTNAGGLDTGSVGNNDYYIWLIARPDTGVVDVLYSLSSTAPTMPASYTFKRLIGWFKRASSAIVAFKTYELSGGGIEFRWGALTLDINSAALTTTRLLSTIKVPLLFSVVATVRGSVTNGGTNTYVILQCPDDADVAVSATVAPMNNLPYWAAITGIATQMRVRTSASGQVATRSSVATATYQVVTESFEWSRR